MKTCEQCGKLYPRRPKEAFGHYEASRCCSKRCAGLLLNPRKADSAFAARYRKVKTPDGRNMLEHRWVMEQVIGRRLKRSEQVHHRNHDGLDNRPENLELVSSAEHGRRHTVHPATKACVICGREFAPHKTKRVRQQTCSLPCKSELLRVRHAERATPRKCGECGEEFRGHPLAVFCSDSCRIKRAYRLRVARIRVARKRGAA